MKIWKFRSMEKEIYGKLTTFLSAHNARIVSFTYYPKTFGNIVVTVEFDGTIFEFATDRGEIICNNKFICDNSYHVAGKNDTVDKLIEIMHHQFFDQ